MKPDTSSGGAPDRRTWSDTASKAETVRLEAVRALPPAVRLQQALDLSDAMRDLALSALRPGMPPASDLQLVEFMLGQQLIPDNARPAGQSPWVWE